MDDLAQMEWVNTFFSAALTQEVVGTSQLGGGRPTCDAVLHSGGADAYSRATDVLAAPHLGGPGCRATWQEERGQARTHLVYRL